MNTHYMIDSPVGNLTCVVKNDKLIHLWIGDTVPGGADIGVEAPMRWLALEEQFDAYFEGRSYGFDVQTDLAGTDFQHAVWAQVHAVPYGEQRTYRQIAEGLGDPYKARAVGQAIATHPMPIIFPGHRIVRSGSKPDASTEKMAVKRLLLQLEARYSGPGPVLQSGVEEASYRESA